MREPFSLAARLRSFVDAGRGLLTLLGDQHNARIHLAATVAVLALGSYCEITRPEWWVLLLCMALVWLAESLNSSLEYLCDAVTPVRHPLIAKAKDVAAGGVLLSAVMAALIGVSIFMPYIFP